jgi:hypothetical protein
LEFEGRVGREDGHARAIGLSGEDATDAGDRDSGDGARNFRGRASGEEKFVVFAAVQDGGDLS